MNGGQLEIHAAYGGLGAIELGRIMSDHNLNPFTQAELLAAALATPFKETGRAHYRSLVEDETGRSLYGEAQIADGLTWLEQLGLDQSPLDGFCLLPQYSFVIDLRFELASPYLSRDDDAFYIIDNPVRKDKVFKVPFVASTGWKGSLRSVATYGMLTDFAQLLPDEPPADESERAALMTKLWEERARRVVLFGNEKKNDAEFLNGWLAPRLGEQADILNKNFECFLNESGYRTEKIEGRQGRLFFFPTFFNRIGLEIINPHDRERRVGTNPILFECVPAGATGTFRLLYVPYDFPSEVTPDKAQLRGQVQNDLLLVGETVRDLLAFYGFGAKTSSGFGTVDPKRVTGELGVNYPDQEPESTGGPSESLVRRLLMDDPLRHRLNDNFFEAGQFVLIADDEIRQQPWGGRTKADYRRVKPRVVEMLAQQPDDPTYLSRPVTTLIELPDLAGELAEIVGGGS